MNFTDSPPWLVGGDGGGGGSGEIQPQEFGNFIDLASYVQSGFDSVASNVAYRVSQDFVTFQLEVFRTAGAGAWSGVENVVLAGLPLECMPVGGLYSAQVFGYSTSTGAVSESIGFVDFVVDGSTGLVVFSFPGGGSVPEGYFFKALFSYPKYKAAE